MTTPDRSAVAGLWPPEAIEAIRLASLALLERVGVQVDSSRAQELLVAAGCTPGPQGQVLATRFMHNCRYPDSINSLVTPGDVPGQLHPLYSYLAIAAETDKLIGGPGLDFPWQARYLAGMAEAVAEARPGARPGDACAIEMGFSPVSPLHLGPGVCEGIIEAVGLGMAVQVLTNPVAGTTAPASLAGALAQQDAEILAGVVLVQSVTPGSPCSYGARLSVADPRSGQLLCGAGQWALASLGATLLARRHGLACDCYGPDTLAWTLDLQLGYQYVVPTLTAARVRDREPRTVAARRAGSHGLHQDDTGEDLGVLLRQSAGERCRSRGAGDRVGEHLHGHA